MLLNVFLSYLIIYLTYPIWLIECCLTRSARNYLNAPDRTRFLLHTSPEDKIAITDDNIGTLKYAKPFKFIAHGYTESIIKNYVPSLVHAYFYRGNYSVVLVDWADLAANEYYVASVHAVRVGFMLAELIVKLRKEAGISFDDIHIIGHSMGCYVASAAGEFVYNMTGHKIARVTGLDPAGPMYEGFLALAPNRMSKEDAKVVDVIHTDNGWFGVAKPTGSIDFFPNGGSAHMPGCRSMNPVKNLMELISYPIEFIFCSHKRSHVYYVRSIVFRNITAVECPSYEDFLAKKCKNNKRVQFGEDLTPGATGTYFLKIA